MLPHQPGSRSAGNANSCLTSLASAAVRPVCHARSPSRGRPMTTHPQNITASIDPVKLNRLAEVAVKVGFACSRATDLMPDCANHRAAAGAPGRQARLRGRRVRHADLPDEINADLPARPAWSASTARPIGSMRAWPRLFRQHRARFGTVGDDPMLLSGQDPEKVALTRRTDRLPAGAGEDRGFRHQLEHRRLSRHLLGQAGVSGTT